MLHAPVPPQNYSLRERKTRAENADSIEPSMADIYDEDDSGGAAKGRSKSRRELPAGAVATLKAWLLSPEHFTHPYPTPQDQVMLMQKTGIDKKQLKNWFTNARRRIWKPMLKKQIEQGKLAAPPAGVVPGAVPGLMMTAAAPVMESAHSVQAMRAHYQQAVEQTTAPPPPAQQPTETYGAQSYQPVTSNDVTDNHPGAPEALNAALQTSASIGTLPQFGSSTQLSKTDSHAVLMELFTRDQDLVRQATESARLKAEASKHQAANNNTQQQPQGTSTPTATTPSQHPMKAPSQPSMTGVPTLNSWPHFSSITSLSNLGSLPGVKSISSLSGVDLASKGSLNKMGNLAQVKSMDSIGKNDSYAFLEVFFGGDRNSTNNLSAMGGQAHKGVGKQPGDEDHAIGLSLEDEAPTSSSSSQSVKKEYPVPAPVSVAPQPVPITAASCAELEPGGTLKRAYDDALAAKGLISVSRSCEKLTDLPEKMQRTLSSEFISRDKTVVTKSSTYGQTADDFPTPQPPFTVPPKEATHPPAALQSGAVSAPPQALVDVTTTDSETDGHVKVSTMTACALCGQVNVDTQLQPCGHMFHERCLKPSLQTPSGRPLCPIDHIPMDSALLAVPTEDAATDNKDKTSSPPPAPSDQQQSQEQNSWTFSSSRALSTENQDPATATTAAST